MSLTPLRCRSAALTARARRFPTTGSAVRTRFYSSTSPPPHPSRRFNPLIPTAATLIAATGLVLFSRSWHLSTRDPTVKCDGAPLVEVAETNGEPWAPVYAIEQDDPNNPMRIRMAAWVKNLQDHIVNTLEELEAAAPDDGEHAVGSFLRDHWIRPSGGEGSSCVLAGGRVFEKAGVNVSIVEGKLPTAAQRQMRADHASVPVSPDPLPYFATGLSIVIHPRNPHAPTVHLNYRYFELGNPTDPTAPPVAWWFGGGSDLTPSYLYPEDAEHFHTTLKAACDKHDDKYYPAYKTWCDKYFYLPHRGETRGVGGLFFDDLTTSSPIHSTGTGSSDGPSQGEIFEFIKSASGAFLPAYVPIVKRRASQPYTEHERRWQLIRRGRYVEFNLLYDRGTKFGLNIPGARVESILMSLPEVARWEYMTPLGAEGSGTREEELVKALKTPRDWAK